jgi:oligopeptide/dipeptide ABC transporter ATP-binding protein
MEHIRGKNISMVFQSPKRSLNPFTPVGAQLVKTILRFNKEINKTEAQEMAQEYLRSVQLYQPQSISGAYPRSLSVGMAQRVVIAIALSSRPKLLIADEPTSGLDTTTKHRIIDLLEDLLTQMNLTLLLISHNIGIVGIIAREIVVMYAGVVVEIGGKNHIISTKRGPRHPYTNALITSIPIDSDKRRRKIKVIPGASPDNRLEMQGCPFRFRCPHPDEVQGGKCGSVYPQMVEVSQGHWIRCHLYSQ